MAQEIRFKIGGAVYSDAMSYEAFGLTISEDDALNIRYAQFDNDLVFCGDVYQYISNIAFDSCACILLDVIVEYKCQSGQWEELSRNYIIINECTFDLDKCKVTTKLFDNTFSTKINNNKSIQFSSGNTQTKNGIAITPPTVYSLRVFNPANGVYDATLMGGVRVEDMFRHLVSCMSDNLIDFASPIFSSGQFIDLMLTNGRALFSLSSQETVVSFETLYKALQLKLNLGIGISLQDNGRPLITIDRQSAFDLLTPSVILTDLSGVKMSFDTSLIYASVKFGNQEYLEQWECNGGETACSFAQTPFRGFKSEQFGLIGECNTATVLDLEVQGVIFDTNVIEDIYRFSSQDYMDSPIIIQAGQIGITPTRQALQGDPYGIVNFIYNAAFTNEAVSNNFIGSIPNSIFEYIQGFSSVDTNGSAITNIANQCWQLMFAEYTSFVEWNGSFPILNIKSPINFPFDSLATYTVPHAGIYTVSGQFAINAAFSTTLFVALIEHFNAVDELIAVYEGTITQSGVAPAVPLVVNVNRSIVCNQGDLIRLNIKALFTDPLDFQVVCIVPLVTIGGSSFATSLIITAIPFEPSTLKEYNPCDFKSKIYDFDSPISMQDLTSILSDFSKPIGFTRSTDAASYKNGWIRKLNVPSVIRKNANFTLKSNE